MRYGLAKRKADRKLMAADALWNGPIWFQSACWNFGWVWWVILAFARELLCCYCARSMP